jgi:hypothetical protein
LCKGNAIVLEVDSMVSANVRDASSDSLSYAGLRRDLAVISLEPHRESTVSANNSRRLDFPYNQIH